MKSRSYCDQILIRPGQMILVSFLYQTFQEHTGQFVDMFHMQSTFTISKLYDLTQNTYHDPVVFLLLINLIRYQCDQSSLFCIQFDRIEYSLINNLCIEWPADIIRYSHFVSPSYTLFGVFTGNHDNRNILDPVIFVHIM